MKTSKLSCVWKAVVIAFLLHSFIVSATANLSNNKVLLFKGAIDDEPIDRSTYIIETNGTHCFLFNVTSRSLEWSSKVASAVFNACIGNLTMGGRILVKSGKYVLTTTITIIHDNITVIGEGEGTELHVADFTSIDAICSYGRLGLVIENLTIDGNKANNIDSGDRGIQHGIDLINCANSKIDYVQVRNCIHTGINLYGGNYNVITNNILLNNGETTYDSGSGIDCDGSQDTFILDNVAEGNYVNGIWVTATSGEATNITVSGNILRYNGGSPDEGHGIHIGTATGTISNSRITNNTVEGNFGYAGILVTSTYSTTIHNNTSNNNKGRGFSFLDSDNLIISWNIAKNNSDFGGFILWTDCSYNLISNNTAIGNANYNVGVLSPSDIENTIINNYFNTTSAIYDNGTNTLIKDNIYDYSQA